MSNSIVSAITSKFINQVSLFFSLSLCLFGNYIPLITFIAGIILVGFVTRGKAFKIIHAQVAFSVFYFRYLQKRYLYPSTRSLANYLSTLLTKVRIIFRPKSIIYWHFTENYWLHLIVSSFPQIFMISLLAIFRQDLLEFDFIVTNLEEVLGSWIVVSFAWMIITSLKPFLFLGEGVRYAENTIMPQILLLNLFVNIIHKPSIFHGLLIYSFIAYLMFVIIYYGIYQKWENVFNEFLPMLLKIDEPKTKIFGVGTFFWPLLYGTLKADILCPMSDVEMEEWEFVYGNYPFPGVKIMQVVNKYKIDYLVGSELSIKQYEEILDDNAFTQEEFTLVDSIGIFRVYSCKV